MPLIIRNLVSLLKEFIKNILRNLFMMLIKEMIKDKKCSLHQRVL